MRRFTTMRAPSRTRLLHRESKGARSVLVPFDSEKLKPALSTRLNKPQDVLGESLGRLGEIYVPASLRVSYEVLRCENFKWQECYLLFRACNCRLQKMSSRLKPFTITKKQAFNYRPPVHHLQLEEKGSNLLEKEAASALRSLASVGQPESSLNSLPNFYPH
jgi:hypothetical protein